MITGIKNKNYYQILGISQDATNKDIKLAYWKLVKKFHPDVKKTNDANEKILVINEAYNTLSDQNKRSQYDRSLFFDHSCKFDNNYTNLEDVFENDFKDYNYGTYNGFSFKQQNIEREQQQFREDYHKQTTQKVKTSNVQNNPYWFQNNNEDVLNDDWIYEDHAKYFDRDSDQSSADNKNKQLKVQSPFKIDASKILIDKFSKAYGIDWKTVIEVLNENQLTKKEIFLRCYYNQHYFNHSKLTAKQLAIESFHKSLLVQSSEYLRFIQHFQKQKKRLDLIGNFYFDESLLTNDFRKIIRYYRLFECNFCSGGFGKNTNHQCNFCFNRRFLKERMAIQISWSKNQKPASPIVFYHFGNRNQDYIGHLIIHLIPSKEKVVGTKKSYLTIDYQENADIINEIIENKLL